MEIGRQRHPPRSVAVVSFPGITALDLVGPIEILRRMQGVSVSFVAHDERPIDLDPGLSIHPDKTFGSTAEHDVVLVPGGRGVNAAMQDADLRSYLLRQAATARYVASVCTGALILGVCGLLEGRRATTHWSSRPLLAELGAEPVSGRVVIDDPMITSAGVSAGIDLAFTLVQLLDGSQASDVIQLEVEYDPEPPSDLAVLRRERPDVVARATEAAQPLLDERRAIIARLRAT